MKLCAYIAFMTPRGQAGDLRGPRSLGRPPFRRVLSVKRPETEEGILLEIRIRQGPLSADPGRSSREMDSSFLCFAARELTEQDLAALGVSLGRRANC